MKPKTTETLIAAIDVGANAVRLEIARGFSDGSIESVHQERDPVRPGEGLFQTGTISSAVVDRVVGVLRRYAIICKRHQARVRAVGTSALREAKNRDDIIRRVKREAGLELEAISGKEEAHPTCTIPAWRGSRQARPAMCASWQPCCGSRTRSTEVMRSRFAICVPR